MYTTTVMTETKLAEVNAYLMSGMTDKEAAEKAGISIGNIWYGRHKGRIVPSTKERNKKTNVKNIDLAHIKLPQLMDNQRLDGTPDTSPAFDEEDTSMDLVEYKTEQPMEIEPKPEEPKEKPKRRATKKITKLVGQYITIEFTETDATISFTQMEHGNKQAVSKVTELIEELKEIQAELMAAN